MKTTFADTLGRRLPGLIAAIYAAVTLAVTGTVLLHADFAPRKFVDTGLIPNIVWAPAMIVLLAAAALLILRRAGRANGVWKGGFALRAAALTAIVLCVQAFTAYHIYYMQEHDALIVFDTAYYTALGYPQYRQLDYFDKWPNNMMLVALETMAISASTLLFGSAPGRERCVLLLVLIQCVINALSGAATLLAARRYAQIRRMPARAERLFCRGGWAMWLLLVGLSPWFTVIYSDSMSLLLPVLILLLYMYRGDGGRAAAVFALIGLLGGLAYRLKPQSSIVLIAVALTELTAMLTRKGQRRAIALRCALLLAAAMLVIGPGGRLAQRIAQMEPDPEKAFGVTHYINQGLNTETQGFFAPGDVELSMSAPTRAERNRVNLESAAQRLEQMGGSGLIAHMRDKLLINFADGSFGWSDFPIHEVEEKNGLSRPLRDIFYYDGAYRPVMDTVQQGAWVIVLLLCPFAVLALRDMQRSRNGEGTDTLCVMLLTVIGVMTFNMIFEPRGRYLFSNVPVLILLSAAAYAALLQRAYGRLYPEERKKEDGA